MSRPGLYMLLDSEIGGPLWLIIIKPEMFEPRRADLLLILMAFIRLKPLSHSVEEKDKLI